MWLSMGGESTKASAVACANQGLVKYWGKTDEVLRLPTNDSISVCLDTLRTHTTVEFSDQFAHDSFSLDGAPSKDPRVFGHLDLIRTIAGSSKRARVESRNTFPAAVGFASSASGFAALTVAGCAALGLSLSASELSRIARRGSASASRSIPGGFSKLMVAPSDEGTIAVRLAGPTELDFLTVMVTVTSSRKLVGSTQGMKITTETSPMFQARLAYLPAVIEKMGQSIAARDSREVAHLAEVDTLNMHATMLTSEPPLIYWNCATIEVMREIQALRRDGYCAYFSIDAGQNVFVNTTRSHGPKIHERLQKVSGVQTISESRPGEGARLVDDHLFR